MLRKIFSIFLYALLILSIGLLFAYQRYPEVNLYVKEILGKAPCQKPILYSIGSFDDKFGTTKQNFLSAINEATIIWEKAVGKNLFEYEENGKLKIHLIHDYRQEATEKMANLGLKIDNTKSNYDELKSELDKRKSTYERDKEEFDSLIQKFETEKAEFEQSVSSWNKKGGAPKEIYDSLTEKRAELQSLAEQIDALQKNLIREVAEINAIIEMLNRVANEINIGVKTYNKIGEETGEEFSEGLYISDISGQRIEIYQFSDKEQLVRLLAHELGHAIGMGHNENPKSIMYRLNESDNLAPTASEILELKKICNIK